MSRQASGLRAWVIQRATAVYLAFFLVYLLLHFLLAPPADHAALRAWVAHPAVAIAFLLAVPLLLLHAWVGIRDVFMDYIKPVFLRLGLLVSLAFVLLASGLWALKAIVLAGVISGTTA